MEGKKGNGKRDGGRWGGRVENRRNQRSDLEAKEWKGNRRRRSAK